MQRTVHRHRLRREFDAARRAEPPVRAQRMIDGAMSAAAAADAFCDPKE